MSKTAFKPQKVNRYTRAPHEGKEIVCPVCNSTSRVYHFAWSALGCQSCKGMITKAEWTVL